VTHRDVTHRDVTHRDVTHRDVTHRKICISASDNVHKCLVEALKALAYKRRNQSDVSMLGYKQVVQSPRQLQRTNDFNGSYELNNSFQHGDQLERSSPVCNEKDQRSRDEANKCRHQSGQSQRRTCTFEGENCGDQSNDSQSGRATQLENYPDQSQASYSRYEHDLQPVRPIESFSFQNLLEHIIAEGEGIQFQ